MTRSRCPAPPDKHDVGLPDVLGDVGGEEEVAAARRLDHLIQACARVVRKAWGGLLDMQAAAPASAASL